MLLGLIGTLLAVASRVSAAIQRQVSCHRVIEIGSEDGVVYHYTFQNRRISFHRGPSKEATCAVRFATARLGFRVLTGATRFEMMMEGVQNGAIDIGGDVAQFLWFEGLLRAALPGRGTHSPAVVLPSRYVAPAENNEFSQYITREPEATELDPAWTTAATQRKKLVIMRVPAGTPLESSD